MERSLCCRQLGKGWFITDADGFGDLQVGEWPELGALQGSWGHLVKSFKLLPSQGLEAVRSLRFAQGFRSQGGACGNRVDELDGVWLGSGAERREESPLQAAGETGWPSWRSGPRCSAKGGAGVSALPSCLGISRPQEGELVAEPWEKGGACSF